MTTTTGEGVNQALRQHVTSASFALVLGSTHIAALVRVDFELRRNRTLMEDIKEGRLAEHDPPGLTGPHRRAFRHDATGINGLIRRGLVLHTYPTKPVGEDRPDEIWEITEAGRLVIGLLKEAGLWAEFGGEA